MGGGGEGGGLCTRKEKSYRMGTHVHTLGTFNKATLFLTKYRDPSNYEVKLRLFKV